MEKVMICKVCHEPMIIEEDEMAINRLQTNIRTPDLIDKCVESFFDKRFSLERVLHEMKARYISLAVQSHNTNSRAADFLGIHRRSLSRILNGK